MTDEYPILSIAQMYRDAYEQMGTKEKFWYVDRATDKRWLFKYSRPNTGEDWAEKIASELAELLGIPHATVDLAEDSGRRGVLSLDFTDRTRRGSLVHGNELLMLLDSGYPKERRFRVREHTVENIRDVLSTDLFRVPPGSGPPEVVAGAMDLFAGYLMLDALIGNTDRHHENWGVLARLEEPGGELYAELAPSYDHASSLGRELTQETKLHRLSTTDRGGDVIAYADRTPSAVYVRGCDKALHPISAFEAAAAMRPGARGFWLDRLAAVGNNHLSTVVQGVPSRIMTKADREFTLKMLSHNRSRLLEHKA